MTREKCRSCGAPIIWAKTAKGKDMPVDAEWSERGNVELTERDGKVFAYVAATHTILLGPAHTSHFATCPNASDWRRK